LALHERFGTIPLATLFEPAITLAEDGFPASPLLVGAMDRVEEGASENLSALFEQLHRPGARVRRPGVGAALRSIAGGGRDAFYRGAFGDGLKALGNGIFDDEDLATPLADWVTPLTTKAFGVDLWTIPPNSQGYLTLGAAALASEIDLPADPDDPRFAHLLVEAATAAGFDRPDVLSDTADGDELLRAIAQRVGTIDRERASNRWAPSSDGDTTYLCTVDANGMGVSLIQSNAAGFGSGLVEPNTGINLHNRGLGFNLRPGHPAARSCSRGVARPTRCARRWPPSTVRCDRCSARWAATLSRRSCCRSRRGCSTTGRLPARPSTPAVGRCTGRPPASTRGPAGWRRR
jgi:gamma-glutamyltranspeptidase/glutathione hydrolase